MKKRKESIRISIVGHDPIFGLALKSVLEAKAEFHADVKSLTDPSQIDERNDPDIFLLNAVPSKGSGTEMLRSCAQRQSMARSIILGDSAGVEEMAEFIDAGARGYVFTEAPSGILLESIKAVMAGKYWIGNKAVSRLDGRFKKSKNSPNKSDLSNYGLTPREMDVIRAVISGLTNREIAQKLAISEQTVKHHITNIFDKLGVYNRLELTLFVFHHGLVES